MRLSLVILVILKTASAVLVTVPGLGQLLGTELQSTWTNRTIHAFYGIQYALPPSGNRRFMPPEPIVDPWKNIYNASKPRRDCPQLLKELPPFNPEEDLEDCLFLNVFTPSLIDKVTIYNDIPTGRRRLVVKGAQTFKKRCRTCDTSSAGLISDSSKNGTLHPVMVNIHGGGFTEGTARYFPPNYLLEKDILLVVIQYRLGPLGFMSLNTDAIPGNAGFMDQVLALKWINKNIKSFGGNKDRVTIFGQSAGAASISLLLMSPMVEESLFQRAIMQSGSATSTWIIDENPRNFTEGLFKELSSVNHDSDDTVIEKHFKSATLLKFQSAVLSFIAKYPSQTGNLGRAVIQKAGSQRFLTSSPSDIIKSGKIRAVPMMAGTTRHDGSYLVTSLYDKMEKNDLINDTNYLRYNLTADTLKALDTPDGSGAFADVLENKLFKKLYDQERNLTFTDVAPGLIDIAGMLVFKTTTLKHAKINSYYGQPTYFYTFDYKGQYTRFGYGEDTSKYPFDGGIHHSNDLLYLFPYHYPMPLNKEDTRMAKTMINLWTSFAIDGVPKSDDSPPWMPLKKGKNGPFYHINTTCYLGEDFVDSEYAATTDNI